MPTADWLKGWWLSATSLLENQFLVHFADVTRIQFPAIKIGSGAGQAKR
jgi:hypothetical protein